jgi:exopolysaccharide biosynthesis protein
VRQTAAGGKLLTKEDQYTKRRSIHQKKINERRSIHQKKEDQTKEDQRKKINTPKEDQYTKRRLTKEDQYTKRRSIHLSPTSAMQATATGDNRAAEQQS